MKHLIDVAVALAISTPAMGATEVVIPKDILNFCDMYQETEYGSCDITPEDHLVVVTRTNEEAPLWGLCIKSPGITPGWRMEIMDLFHTQVFKCPTY
jgi:hypothetical protein